MDVTVQPQGFVAAAHVHPNQTEEFRVLAGTVGFKLGRERLEKRAGDVVVVDPGMPHKFWNAGDEPARFIAVVRPALQFEQLIETTFSLAADGKTNRKGMPNPFRLAVIAQAHFEDVHFGSRPRHSSAWRSPAVRRSAGCSGTRRRMALGQLALAEG